MRGQQEDSGRGGEKEADESGWGDGVYSARGREEGGVYSCHKM